MTGIGNCCCDPPHEVCLTVYSCRYEPSRLFEDVHIVIRGPSPDTDIVCEGDTDASGQFCCSLAVGTYTVEATYAGGRYATYTGTVSSPGGGSILMEAASGYACCPTLCFHPTKTTLYATWSKGSATLTHYPGAAGGSWRGCGTFNTRTGVFGYSGCELGEDDDDVPAQYQLLCGGAVLISFWGCIDNRPEVSCDQPPDPFGGYRRWLVATGDDITGDDCTFQIPAPYPGQVPWTLVGAVAMPRDCGPPPSFEGEGWAWYFPPAYGLCNPVPTETLLITE
jgi:hypothetical protein